MDRDALVTPMIFIGRVMHRRDAPVYNAFVYPTFFLRLPLSQLGRAANGVLRVNRWGLLSFQARDHGPRDGSPLEPWVHNLLATANLPEADGEIVLQAYPRVLGFVFNPVSFYYCHGRDGALRAVIAAVNNTFGENHNYILAHADRRPILETDVLTAKKVFHVSPFFSVTGGYRFRFKTARDSQLANIDYCDAHGHTLTTAIYGKGEALTGAACRKALLAQPLMTFAVVARIHWQALKLWVKRVPFFTKPEPPTTTISLEITP